MDSNVIMALTGVFWVMLFLDIAFLAALVFILIKDWWNR